MNRSQIVRIALEFLGGIVLSIILCAVLIFFGYCHVNSSQINQYVVKFISIPIYEISKNNDKFVGTALNKNMSTIGIGFSIISMVVAEMVAYFKKKNK